MKKITLVLKFIILFFCFSCDQFSTDSVYEESFLLDKTLHINNQIIEDATSRLISEADKVTKREIKCEPFAKQAKEVKAINKDFLASIDALIKRLIEESGGLYTTVTATEKGQPELVGLPIGQLDKKTPQHIFLAKTENHGVQLEQKILDLKKAYLDFIEKRWENGGTAGTIFADPSKKEAALHELEYKLTLTSSENHNKEVYGGKTWVEYTFGNKSVAAVLFILRKFQNDAITSENIVLQLLVGSNYCYYEWGLTFKSYDVLCQPSKPFVHQGETFEAEISLGKTIKEVDFSASVNGTPLKIENGKALFQAKGIHIGEQKYTAKISVTNPLTGAVETFQKDFYYEVLK